MFRSINAVLSNWRVRRVGIRLSCASRVLTWLRSHELPNGGIRVHSAHSNAYPKLTGYLIPTLLRYGERDLAMRLLRWLMVIQRGDGAYTDPDGGLPYVFDTAQVLRGLLAGADLESGALTAARRAADYLCSRMVDGGRGGFGVRCQGDIPESVHLYALPPLVEAADRLDCPTYRVAAERCLDYYAEHPQALQMDILTHFLGYELEALIELGRAELALPVLDRLRGEQMADGAVRGKAGVRWVCTPGLAQLAICWYKVGQWEPADKALAWLEAHQQPSGGFLGSNGPGADYFPNVELSWAAKFYLDAHLLRTLAFFERNAHIFPETVAADDRRLQALLAVIRPHDRVLEVGCGKGRFLKAIKAVHPAADCMGVDISPALLAHIPADIAARQGALEAIPCADDHFDVVFSVEAIEHSTNLQAAVAEMIRVARPGGWVVIVDKQQTQWGRLACPPWERWPAAEELAALLRRGCDNVAWEPVGYEGHPADGLMLAWRGQKRSPLSGAAWNETLVAKADRQALIERVRSNQRTPWALEVLLATAPGERVLEIGSGTGEISLGLALAGRQVTILDISQQSLDFAQACAADLGLRLEAVCSDAQQPLPFPNDFFDCVWSSGLLEHFTPAERRAMLREWRRVARGRVISLVPNAASVAYRMGKALMEREGRWPYGLEIPILSLREDFEAVGLYVMSECSVGEKHALSFLPADHPLRKALSSWIESMSLEELRDCNQGYLLVTIGVKYPGGPGC
ncbi:MAG: methyltransferase domain-containing protein [bacterium]